MNACEISASITAVANAVGGQLTTKQLAYWGLILSQLGAQMGALAALRELEEDAAEAVREAAEIEEIGLVEETEEESLAAEEIAGESIADSAIYPTLLL